MRIINKVGQTPFFRETIESIKDFYEPGIQQIVQMRDTGGTPDETAKVIGNQGFTRRQFFDASNRQMGETGQLLLDTLTFIDPTGQASLPQTTYNWENGNASNFQMGGALVTAITGPLNAASGGGAGGQTTSKVSGWVERKIFGELDSSIQKKIVSALQNGIVGPTGQQGVVKLTASEAAKTGFTHKIKILGKGGDIRIYGTEVGDGRILFTKIDKH